MMWTSQIVFFSRIHFLQLDGTMSCYFFTLITFSQQPRKLFFFFRWASFSRRQICLERKRPLHSPSSVLFLAISAKSISEFGSFMSDEDDDDEFCIWSWPAGWACDRSRLLAWTVDDGAIEWWFWNDCIIDNVDVRCKWDTCDIPLLNDDDTQTDIKTLLIFLALYERLFRCEMFSGLVR